MSFKRLICIPATKHHIKYVDFSIKILLEYFPNDDFLIVTPNTDSFNYLKRENVVVEDDNQYLDLSAEQIKLYLTDNKKSISKWYFQQFLKYSIINKSKKYTDILIVDADTILLSDCIKDVNSINLTTLEYNTPYFDFICNYFPNQIILTKSSIVNFMWFNTNLFGEMLNSIEGNGHRKWFDVILEDINKSPSLMAFSEYETYANYKYNNHNTGLKN